MIDKNELKKDLTGLQKIRLFLDKLIYSEQTLYTYRQLFKNGKKTSNNTKN